jgi:hypothetical protein
MSKVSKLAQDAINQPIASRAEAVGNAQFVLAGKRTITKDEAIKLFGAAADELDVQFNRLERNMAAVVSAEIEVSKRAKALMSASKDLAGQVGCAMERIDKVVARDFEAKLTQLERFVSAMKELDELKRSGRLDAVIFAFQSNGRKEAA